MMMMPGFEYKDPKWYLCSSSSAYSYHSIAISSHHSDPNIKRFLLKSLIFTFSVSKTALGLMISYSPVNYLYNISCFSSSKTSSSSTLLSLIFISPRAKVQEMDKGPELFAWPWAGNPTKRFPVTGIVFSVKNFGTWNCVPVCYFR